jgi:competence protein ComEC
LGHLRDFAFVSLAAMVGTWPLVAHHFNRISVVGFLSNLIVVPLIGLIVPLGLVTSLVALIWLPASSLLATLTSAVSFLVLKAVGLFASIPHASHYVVRPNLFEIGLCYLVILHLANIRRTKRLGGISILLVLAIAGDVSYWYARTHLTNSLRVTFIDVGQGDSSQGKEDVGRWRRLFRR